MQKSHVDSIMYLFCLNENHCGQKKKKKIKKFFYIFFIRIVIVKNNIAIRIAGKVSRYIDASMNRATPSGYVGCHYATNVSNFGYEPIKFFIKIN